MNEIDGLETLRAENARLAELLDAHGIVWRLPQEPVPPLNIKPSRLATDEKVALFRKLFRGRTDVYPIRWEGKTSGKSGYAPACANEWRTGVCEKPRIKCGDCNNRLLIPVSDAVIYGHLAGDHTVGVYPLLEDDTCHFLAVDFDEAEWRDDASAFIQSCDELGVPAALEISRSGQGAHAWIFFASAVSARDARRLGTAIISHTCSRTRQLKLTSYDRLFPNQDTMPKGGFGNLIALPLQKKPREDGFSVFVDSDLRPHPDQWAFLASIAPMPAHDIEPTILRATGGVNPLDVTFIDDEDLATPWRRHNAPAGLARISHPPPAADADTLAVARRHPAAQSCAAGRTGACLPGMPVRRSASDPSIRLNVPSSTSSPSLSPRGAPQRRLGALATERCEKCGLAGPMPAALTVTLANQVYFEKAELAQALANRLIRLAAFQNPEFYRAQAMRMSVWDKPRVVGCAENYPRHIALPRGCFDAASDLLADNGIRLDLRDERHAGEPIAIGFAGTLRPDQEAAVAAMLRHDAGVLCAPTAFGKTVTAAAMIARRGVNTLVLVHRTELLKQWQQRLAAFLGAGKGVVGVIGGGKTKPTGMIDIAVMQSISRQGEVDPVVENYGQIIVDECHHIGAASFDAILRRAKAKYVLGLTATPIRRDGQQPIIFMQCGPIRHKAAQPAEAPHDLAVTPQFIESPIGLPQEAGIQDVFRHLAQDQARTAAIANAITDAFRQGRKVLALTERTEHIDAIRAALADEIPEPCVLHGRMSKKQRATLITALDALPPNAPRVLLATGKLVGEGFDHPPLDTLVLAMPVSWKGTLQQYAGRLHREHASKTDVRIIDFVDTGHPALLRMWDKRQRGYRAMGYRIGTVMWCQFDTALPNFTHRTHGVRP